MGSKTSKKRKPVLITRRELAGLMGVHMSAVTKWERDGMPIAKRGSRGRASLYRESACRAWKKARDQAAAKAAAPISLEHERARRERGQAMLAEQTYRTRDKDLLPRADVERIWLQHVGAVRNALLHLPQALADQLARAATLQGPAAVEQKLRDAITAILEELSGQSAEPA